MFCVPDNANPFSSIILILSTGEVCFVIPIMHKTQIQIKKYGPNHRANGSVFKDRKDFNPLKKWLYDEAAQILASLVLYRKFSDIGHVIQWTHFPSTALSSLCPNSASLGPLIFSSKLHGLGTLFYRSQGWFKCLFMPSKQLTPSPSPPSLQSLLKADFLCRIQSVLTPDTVKCSADICWARMHAWMTSRLNI